MATHGTSNGAQTITLETDSARHILRLHYRGTVLPAHVKAQIGPVQEGLKKLSKGFVLVTDLTGLEAMDLDCVGYVTKIMDLCYAAGVGKVVRIIPDPSKDIGLNLLSHVHYRGRVPMATCETQAEAEKEISR
jgi:hypothetical protein